MQGQARPGTRLDAAFYDFTQDVLGALGQALAALRARAPVPLPAPPVLLQVRRGYAESPGWFLVQALEFDSAPLTVAGLRVRDVYASERIVAAILELMAGEQWLDRRRDEYFLAAPGRALLQEMRDRQRHWVADLAPLPASALGELEGLLAQVIGACQRAVVPAGWCLAHSIRRAPGAAGLPLERIRQDLEDLNAFRDDAHMAAWQPHGLGGYVWEAFAHVCRGAAATGAALFPLLAHRGYSRQEYDAAVDDLAARGWLAPTAIGGGYAPTPVGQEVREAVEMRTDQYFYDPWQVLTAAELGRLKALLAQMKTGLAAVAAGSKRELSVKKY